MRTREHVPTRRELKAQIDKAEQDFALFRDTVFTKADFEAWARTHETNHHGFRSKAMSAAPWTAIAIVASTALQVLEQLARG